MTGILDALLDYQLQTFANNYVGASREVFFDQESGALRHPGEFGGLVNVSKVVGWVSLLLRERPR
jgi:hypothetical protein